jgi:hypothetical protein
MSWWVEASGTTVAEMLYRLWSIMLHAVRVLTHIKEISVDLLLSHVVIDHNRLDIESIKRGFRPIP